MNDLEFQEEWLSAYLDDELTNEQRQVVEQRLAVDPVAQATLEDLRRVRAMVAKLPGWPGSGLKFSIPNELPGSVNEEDGELGYESEEEQDDFEDVPQSLVTTDQPLRSANPQWDPSDRAPRPIFAWIGIAASVLLTAGLGYMFWQPGNRQIASREFADPAEFKANVSAAPAAKTKSESSESLDLSAAPPDAPRPEESAISSSAADMLPRSVALEDIPSNGSDPGPLAKNANGAPSSAARMAESRFFNATDPKDATANDSKSTGETQAVGDMAAQGRFGGLSGRGRSENDLAFNSPAHDSPAYDSAKAPGLLPPGPMRSNLNEPGFAPGAPSQANPPTQPSAAANASQVNQRGALFGPTVFARSQSWDESETQLETAAGANTDILGLRAKKAEQEITETPTESVLMAAIKPEVANSPEFFQEIIATNRLVEVDQEAALNQKTAMARSLSANSLTNSQLGDRNRIDGQAGLGAEPPVAQRNQLSTPSHPVGNSMVLFLNRDEANQILNQLQEKGQVSSQVWRVIKQPESTRELSQDATRGIAGEKQNAAGSQADVEMKRANALSIPEKVILLLNGPPQ